MIRLVQRRLIIPRGDTGTFSIPVLKPGQTGNVAVFTIFDDATKTKVFTKEIASEGDVLNITLTHLETVNLQAGKYLWDIKYYSNPVYTDDELTDGEEVDSYYAGFTLPVCEIRETADNFLLADNAPGATLTPTQLDMISAALRNLQHGIAQVQENVEHYPYIQDNYWYVWDSESEQFVNTEVCANGIPGRTPIIQDDKWWMWDAETEEYVDSGIPVYPDISNLILAQEEQPTEEENKIWFKTSESDVLELPTYDEMVETVQNVVVYQEEQPDSDLNRIWIPTTSEQTVAIPSYEEFEEGLAAKLEAKDVAAVAISGDYADLEGAPTGVSAFTNDAGYLTAHQDLSGKQDKLTFDSAPTANSNNPVTSGGIYDAITHINTMKIHVCSTQEYDNEGIPTVANPTADTFYLVPGGEGTNLFVEWAFVDGAWERFGSADVDLSNYVQKTDYATTSDAGVVKVGNGLAMSNNGTIGIQPAPSVYIKAGDQMYNPISPKRQHESTFYGLAKAAGDTTQSQSSNDVGDYTDEAKAAIQTMLDVPAKGDIPDTSIYATKTDTVLETSLSRGRKEGSTVGSWSLAFGHNVEASGAVSYAGGLGTIASGFYSNVHGKYNVADSYDNWAEWVANTEYVVGDKVKYIINGRMICYVCNEANSDANFQPYKWTLVKYMNYSEIVGNGTADDARSNAYALDWDGNGHYMGDLYVHANADSSGGVKLATVEDIPDAPVQDVQVNGVSVLSNGVANVPVANGNDFGVVKVGSTLTLNSSGFLAVNRASGAVIKEGTVSTKLIPASLANYSTFYGLAKAAGADMKDIANTEVGVYPDAQKTAIRAMLGATSSNVIAVQDTTPTDVDTKIWLPETAETPVQVPTVAEMEQALAEKVGDVQVNGVSVVANGVANVPLMSGSVLGVAKTNGVDLIIDSNGSLLINGASNNEIKTGSGAGWRKAIIVDKIKAATFYGLAKAAGDTTQSQTSSNDLVYTPEAKAAIQTMLGIDLASIASQVDIPLVETVTGTAVTIPGQPNTRYMCGEVLTITITPPASGSIDVFFISGTSAAVLTVPSTVKFPDWFNSAALETNVIYEILITDGVYGSVMTWAN